MKIVLVLFGLIFSFTAEAASTKYLQCAFMARTGDKKTFNHDRTVASEHGSEAIRESSLGADLFINLGNYRTNVSIIGSKLRIVIEQVDDEGNVVERFSESAVAVSAAESGESPEVHARVSGKVKTKDFNSLFTICSVQTVTD